MHFFFAYPNDRDIYNNASSRLGAGLDVRGEGGQVIAAPTIGANGAYSWIKDRGPMDDIPLANAPEWLLELVVDTASPVPTTSDEKDEAIPLRPSLLAVAEANKVLNKNADFATEYNERTTWDELLLRDGWTLTRVRQNGEREWTRPGKNSRDGTSATTGYRGQDILYNFSTSIPWLPTERGFDKFGYMVRSPSHGFNGDFVAAGRQYGKQPSERLAPKGDMIVIGDDVAESGNVEPPESVEVDPEKRHGRITWASDIEPQITVWTWKNRIPAGELTLLAGREGLGKTTIAYTLAAYLTTGTLYGDFHGKPRSALIVATEDSWAKTIRPRFEAAGADLSRIARLDVIDRGLETEIDLPVDIEILNEALKHGDFGLLILDPLISRLSAQLDTHRDGDVRKALEPLVAWSHATGVAVLGLIHVNKGGSGDPLTAVMGSRAFTAVARAVLTVMRSPTTGDRLLGLGKSNLGPIDPEIVPTFSYRIESVMNTHDIVTGKLVWGKEYSREISEIWEESVEDRPESRSRREEANEWLEEYLTIYPEGRNRQLVIAAGKEFGHSESTLRKASLALGVDTFAMPQIGKPAAKGWRLPLSTPTDNETRFADEPF
jgi:hypothetical protein